MIIADVPRVEMTREQLEQVERLERFRKRQEDYALSVIEKAEADTGIPLREKAKQMEEQHRWEKQRADDRQVGGTHYKDRTIQPWDVIDTFDHAQAIGFYKGNAIKYIIRAGSKGPAREDYEKAVHYLEKLLEIL